MKWTNFRKKIRPMRLTRCDGAFQLLNSLSAHGKKATHCPAITVCCRVKMDSFFRSPVRCARFEYGTRTGFPFRRSETKSEQFLFCPSNLATRYFTPSTSWISAEPFGTVRFVFMRAISVLSRTETIRMNTFLKNKSVSLF